MLACYANLQSFAVCCFDIHTIFFRNVSITMPSRMSYANLYLTGIPGYSSTNISASVANYVAQTYLFVRAKLATVTIFHRVARSQQKF